MIAQKSRGLLSIVLLTLFFQSMQGSNHFQFYAGPHHNYMRLKFNNPNPLGGYTTGVTTGLILSKKWFFVHTDYEGYFSTGLMHGAPCQTSKVQEQLLALKLGACWNACDCFSFRAYVGFGFDRFLNHQDPADTCEGMDGLLYKYTKLTVPVGLYAIWNFTKHSSLGLHGEWRPDVFARLHILCDHLNNKKNNAFRVSLPFKHTLRNNRHVCFYFAPFFDWNRFGKVCATNCNGTPFSIPQLTRWDLGARFCFGFQF